MKLISLILIPLALLGQAPKNPLLVTILPNLTAAYTTECGGVSLCLDNRSIYTRNNDYSSFYATGVGTWSVTMDYADATPGPVWTTFGSAATVDNTSSIPVGFGYGTHNYIHFTVSGAGAASVTISYSGSRQFYYPPGGSGGSVVFPITIGQGGTNAATAPAALVNLGLGVTGVPVGDGAGTFTGVAASSQLQQLRRKANTSTTQYEFFSPHTFYAVDYAFTPQTQSAGLISGGVGQTVTMTPCPLGVDTATTHYSVRLIDGSAETVTVSGGTCSSGASTGTLIISAPTSNHTAGAYTVGPASGGIQEAFNVAQGGDHVILPYGATNIYGTIWLWYKTIRVSGNSQTTVVDLSGNPYAGTTLWPQSGTMDTIHIIGVNGSVMEDFTISNGSTAATAGAAIVVDGCANLVFRYLSFRDNWNSIYTNANGSGSDIIDHCNFIDTQNEGIHTYTVNPDSGADIVTNCIFAGSDLTYASIAHYNGGGMLIQGNGFHQFSRYGVFSQPTGASSQLMIYNNTFDGVYGNGIFLQPLANWDQYHIEGNTFSNFNNSGSGTYHGATGYQAIWVYDTKARHGIIANNIIQTCYPGPCTTGLNLVGIEMGGTDWNIHDNTFHNAVLGIQLAGATTVTIGYNRMDSVTDTPYYLSSASGGYSVLLNNPGPGLPYSQMTSITMQDGSMAYCSDCTIASPCASGGTGALAKRLNGALVCN